MNRKKLLIINTTANQENGSIKELNEADMAYRKIKDNKYECLKDKFYKKAGIEIDHSQMKLMKNSGIYEVKELG